MTTLKPIPRILITPGEPAGIGVDVTLQITQTKFPAEIIAISDPELLVERANQLGMHVNLIEANLASLPTVNEINTLKVLPIKLKEKVFPGKLNKANVPYVINCLEQATELCLEDKADALVTGPVQKNIINEAGINFTGHTEFLAERCKTNEVLMLFVVDNIKVALLTVHLSLQDVPKNITTNKLTSTLKLLHKEMQKYFGINNPRITVCGLNPHAGENGLLGNEEKEIIAPVIQSLQKENFSIQGPLPADTVFTKKVLSETDVVLAMYHDQALPVVKYAGFDRAVNMTLGLPIIRTSVDHGTALDIAGTNQANAGSMHAAINLAINLANKKISRGTL